MINTIIEEPYEPPVSSDLLEKTALAVLLAYSDLPESDLTIVIDGDDRLRELNNEYLAIDEPTDVLSFPAEEEEVDPETGRLYLGDIVISYPRALAQSSASGHAVEAEISLLVIHGVLHLLGFDHAEPEEKQLMWSAQREMLNSLGIQLNRYPD
jgi:probable rRNA maturation factor